VASHLKSIPVTFRLVVTPLSQAIAECCASEASSGKDAENMTTTYAVTVNLHTSGIHDEDLVDRLGEALAPTPECSPTPRVWRQPSWTSSST